MRPEFQCTLGEAAKSLEVEEAEPQEGEDTVVHGDSPPRVMHIHCQHKADHVKSFMEQGERLTMGGNWATPLITEVHCFYFHWHIS